MKKLVSVILALIMSIALVTAAPAEGTPWFAWAFNTETGLLVIGGEGELPVFTEENPAPWARFQDRITRLILDEGITGIPAGAFAECVNLVSLVLPASLESVDETAFTGCKKLTQIQTSGDTEATKALFAEILPAGDRLTCVAADLTRLEREVRSVGKPRLIPGYDGMPSEAPETVQTRAAGTGSTAGNETAGAAASSTEASAPKGEGGQDPAASAAGSGHAESASGGSSGGNETAAAAGSSESTAASSGSTAGTGSAGNAGGTETAGSGTAQNSTTNTTARSKLHGTSTAGGKTQGFWSQVNNEIDTENKTITITETKTYDDGSQVVIVDHVTNFDENNIAGANPQTRTVTTTDAQGNTTTQTYDWAPRGGEDSRYMVVDQQTKEEVIGADPTSTGQSGQDTPIESLDSHYYKEYDDGTAFEQNVFNYPDENPKEEPPQENPVQDGEPTP